MDFIFIIGIFYTLTAIVGILLINSRPDFAFWLLINMYFDPGGYLSYISEFYLGRIDFNDILIVFIFIAFYKNYKKGKIPLSISMKRFLIRLFYFILFYFIIYAALIPFLKNDLNYATFLLKNRRFIYGVVILYGTYLFALRDLKYLYSTTLFVGFLTLSLFWISITTATPLIQYAEFERYSGSGINRIGMYSYGIFDLLFPLAVIAYFLSKRIKFNLPFKKLLYVSGVLMLITLLVTLTRRTIIDVIGMTLIIIFLISKFTEKNIITFSYKIFVPIVLVVFTLFILKPNYLTYIGKITNNTYYLLTTGEDKEGRTDNRVTGGGIYNDVFQTIGENVFLGTGYTYFHWEFKESRGSVLATSTRGLQFGQLADAAQEIPIVNLFFSFGIIGFLFLLPLYVILVKTGRNIYKMLKLYIVPITHHNPFTVIFSIYTLVWMLRLFSYNLWALGDQFIGVKFQINAFWIGLLLAMYYRNSLNIINNGSKLCED